MGVLALFTHVINFLAPALWLALGLTLVSRIFMKKGALAQTPTAQIAIIFAACSGVLVTGLVVFGRDGKMLTYAALVLVGAGVQGWLQRGSR
ncbi:MAG: hypothetical protein KBF66_07600 [Rhodoferax sp.]|uniref:hypothetical protein n=1 Tax=Rhodoferax sp. TaxID=50421 RepID=UPI001B401B6F|nr:hypothetical protein [Rhodoferax sp.]MBP9905408.1 hypothetical protein [Rhodoferax sp.]